MNPEKLTLAISLIQKASRITVFTGAGISTNCGIPDFRSAEGIYSFAKERYNLPYGEAIFDIDYFKQRPEPFFQLSGELYAENIQPSLTHLFLQWLETCGKEVSIVTQNIDMLHHRAGSSNILSCHGSYKTGTCIRCREDYHEEDYIQNLKNGSIPYCSCGGVIKPDVVFFGEMLPERFYAIMETPPPADLLLVLGTSLSVFPAARYPLIQAERMPSILVNRDPTQYDDAFDLTLYGDLDEFSRKAKEAIGD